jgi:hypothetical protein
MKAVSPGRGAGLLVGLLSLAPVVFALAVVIAHAQNVVIDDEFRVAQLLQEYDAGTLGLGDFFEQHVLHRVFFPLLLMFGLAVATGFNSVAFSFATLLLLGVNLALWRAAYAKLLGKQGVRSLRFLPVPFLVFSLCIFETMLSGFDITFVMPLTAALAAFGALDRLSGLQGRAARLGFALAAACAIVASFSSSMGLMVWIAGVWPLWCARPAGGARRRWIATWLFIGVLTWTAYFHDFQRYSPVSLTAALSRPFELCRYVIVLLGTPLSFGFFTAPVAGVVVATLMAGSVARSGRRGRIREHAFWLASSCFGLMSLGAIAAARLPDDTNYIVAPRYCLYSISIAISAYVLLVDHARRDRDRAARAGLALMTAMILLSVPAWYVRGLDGADLSSEQRRSKAFILATYRDQPAAFVRRVHPNARFLLRMAPFLERKRYNVFSRALLPEMPAVTTPIEAERGSAGFAWINGKRAEELEGAVESMAMGYGYLHLSGWAIDPLARQASGGVFVAVGERVYPVCYGLRFVNREGFSIPVASPRIGFERAIPIAHIGRGEHQVSLLVCTSDGARLFTPIPVAKLLVR